MSGITPVLALHGGAGARPDRDYAVETAHMRALVEDARNQLATGAAALDVAVAVVEAMEASGHYVAGRGSSPNDFGRFELDAAVMHGALSHTGAVAALTGICSPVRAARAVLTHTPHVLLVGEGARLFALRLGLSAVENDRRWFAPVARDEANHAPSCGTVGCVVRDRRGELASATSTGGVFDKQAGRVGDTPLPGAGIWADGRVAVATTGQGEIFIRTAAAAQVAHRLRFTGAALGDAVAATLSEVAGLGGYGGMIAVAAEGSIAVRTTGALMRFASLDMAGRIQAGIL